MNNNVRTNTNQVQETATEIQTNPPDICDVMLLNSAVVAFHVVSDVLSEVLQISENRAMQIALTVDRVGKGSVFLGPRDVAEQFQGALTAYARSQHNDETEGQGYDLITFQVEAHQN